ncbi:hypothetical protein BN8_01490 [Fibrisoma limi BUZ 3]|uniref:Uncharacterized protein n=1 Tax=Fibrisoma limi BUZ 3 TaxID=1185876 RepID=I2GF10_9BACT|nr:hypothetical protein [Fibrisoma limi]CCH52485.1 hypothetical protein BN8_01490 [Fibrisoma limi BUZ 3]
MLYTPEITTNQTGITAYNGSARPHPESEQEMYPGWQQSQYLQSMFSVRNEPVDIDRYPDVQRTSARALLSQS